MAYNNDAKRLFEQFKHNLPLAIREYRLSLTGNEMGDILSNMIRDMPDGADKEQIKRVLNCKDYFFARADKQGNARYAIPFSYFMKEGCDENFVRSLLKNTFRVYGSRERYVTTASSHYELLAKVIMVLGRGG
jgi:hypothetical protein|nr:MAG TPA: hypothetical protein [Caudoviricetes sp.]